MKIKNCIDCNKEFRITAPAHVLCSECKSERNKKRKELNRIRAYEAWKERVIKEGRSHVIGVGKGGSNKKGSESTSWKNGISYFHKRKKELKNERRYCERCNKDLIDATTYEWVCHHKDHNRDNNVDDNFEIMCKRCHQLEHDCIKNLESATTIDVGSSESKRPTS